MVQQSYLLAHASDRELILCCFVQFLYKFLWRLGNSPTVSTSRFVFLDLRILLFAPGWDTATNLNGQSFQDAGTEVTLLVEGLPISRDAAASPSHAKLFNLQGKDIKD